MTCRCASSIVATSSRPGPEQPLDAVAAAQHHRPMARILVAEDEDILRGLLQRALGEAGHEVITAADGAEALDLLTSGPPFDLLLADIKMPVMDGIALALATARCQPETVILLMTGYAEQRERAHGLDALIHGIVAKPFTVADIRFEVAAALAVRAPE